MKSHSLIFKQPLSTDIETGPIPEPTGRQLLVATRLSAISAGTEMLVFNGQFPADLPVDETIGYLAGRFQYPLAYGYSCVGEVISAGHRADPDWVGQRVFAFHPHESHFCAAPADLIRLPDDLPDEDAVFLASMETAVNLVMDGRPVIGERVMVWGQGVIGLLTTALLSRYPLRQVAAVDRLPLRRRAAAEMGADLVLSGREPDLSAELCSRFEAASADDDDGKPDLIFEVSGHPDCLDAALSCAGFHTRIVIGSWYGSKPASIDLGGRFHRDRITLRSSQVSTIAPALRGRWSSARRLQTVCRMLAVCRPGRLITQRLDIRQAQKAYEMLADRPEDLLQVVFTYPQALG